MSGIVGIWNLDGQPVDQSLLRRMSMTLAHRGPDGERIQIQSSIGMACQNLQVTPESVGEIQPLVHSSGVMLVFDGRIDNREDLLRNPEIAKSASSTSSDAALVLAAYPVFGEKLPEHLNGDFAFGLFDPERPLFVLVRDAIGVRPLYYYRGKDFFIFASEIKALLAHPGVSTRPNDAALASFLLGGNNGYGGVRGTTFFEGVYSLPPAHMAVMTKSGFEVKQYWDFDPAQQVRLGSFQEYAEAFRGHFERAVQRRIRSAFPVAVTVSGGLDSSAIFCQAETLRRAGKDCSSPILGFSWVYDAGAPADEQEFLAAIEQEYGIGLRKIHADSKGSFEVSNTALWYTETPLLSSSQKDKEVFSNLVKETGAKTILAGHWGDQFLFDMAYLVDLFHKLQWRKVFHHLDEFPHWMPDADLMHFKRRIFFKSLLRYHIPDAVMHLVRKFRWRLTKGTEDRTWYTKKLQDLVYANEDSQMYPTNQNTSAHFKSFYDMVKSNYYVLCMEHNNKANALFGVEISYPFLDRDLISFLMSIPGETLAENGCPKALLRQSMHGILPKAIQERRGKADFTIQANEGSEKDLAHLVEIFQREALSINYGYVSSAMIRAELSKLKNQVRDSSDATLGWKLEKLFALEVWLKVFFENSFSR